ncbi:hypothetical protein RJG79_10790 [Mycoplasmatota bacterium WC44]
MLTQLKDKLYQYLLSDDLPNVRIGPGGAILLGDSTYAIGSAPVIPKTLTQTLKSAISQQPSHRAVSDIVDVANDERFVSLDSFEDALRLFTEFILDNISAFFDVANTEDSYLEFVIGNQNNNFELYVLLSGDIAIIGLGFYEVILKGGE